VTRCYWCQRPVQQPRNRRGRPREYCSNRCKTAYNRAERRIFARRGVDTLLEYVWGALEAWRSPALDVAAMENGVMRVRMDELAAHPLIAGSRADAPAQPVPHSLNGNSPAFPSPPTVQGRGILSNRRSRSVRAVVTVATEK
jgi:hypothetical protein